MGVLRETTQNIVAHAFLGLLCLLGLASLSIALLCPALLGDGQHEQGLRSETYLTAAPQLATLSWIDPHTCTRRLALPCLPQACCVLLLHRGSSLPARHVSVIASSPPASSRPSRYPTTTIPTRPSPRHPHTTLLRTFRTLAQQPSRSFHIHISISFISAHCRRSICRVAARLHLAASDRRVDINNNKHHLARHAESCEPSTTSPTSNMTRLTN